jgi:hypothetical protein
VEGIWFDVQGCHLIVGDLDALLINLGVKLTGDGEAGLGGGAGDQLDDGQVVLSALVPASIAGPMRDEIFQAASNTFRTVAVRRRKWNLR